MFKLSHGFDLTTRISILSMILAGCSIVNTFVVQDGDSSYVDSRFRQTLDSFYKQALWHGIVLSKDNISIMFDLIDNDPAVVGTCAKFGNKKIIRIRTNYWEFLSPEEQEVLVFHELAHCLLNRNHCDHTENKQPISIMNSNVINSELYKQKRNELIDELFSTDERCN